MDQVKAGVKQPHTEIQTYRQVFATKPGQSVQNTKRASKIKEIQTLIGGGLQGCKRGYKQTLLPEKQEKRLTTNKTPILGIRGRVEENFVQAGKKGKEGGAFIR